ncbi:MAG TPA: ATP-binding protein [Terriglobales bacterium]|nr:ATP-binding protein [Terriglobales bacterium]
MSLRTKLILLFTITIAVSVALVTWIATLRIRQAFNAADAQHTAALITQFRQEFARRGQEVTSSLSGIAEGEAVQRIALEALKPAPDYSTFVDEARALAESHQLDFLEIVAPDGTIISSAQWPARFGYKEEWLTQAAPDWSAQPAFLKREELPDGPALALVAVRPVRVAETTLFVTGGIRLDRQFLKSLVLPSGMRALLYTNTAPGFAALSLEDAKGPVTNAAKLAPLIQKVQVRPAEISSVVQWDATPAGSEAFQAIPLQGRNDELLGILLIGTSRRDLVEVQTRVRNIAFIVGGIGIFVGLLLSAWAASRVTRPVERLAAAATEVAAGKWNTQVEISGSDEIAQLADSFNQMTRELIEQRDRLVQSERVAAWRELARRLAHELKNPLFPLQITIENLVRSRDVGPEQFDEVFRESTTTLLAELSNLKAIIGRFSDFAKMPTPQLQFVNINEVVRRALKTYEAQLTGVPHPSPSGEGANRPAITAKLEFHDGIPEVLADPELLHRAVSNLILNAMDAMPNGGTLVLRTRQNDGSVRIEIADSGTGLTKEECARLFTPYYTTKQHGTGLGLAIVQSVVADHHGRIAVESEPDRGTTFRIDLPVRPETHHTGDARGASVQ